MKRIAATLVAVALVATFPLIAAAQHDHAKMTQAEQGAAGAMIKVGQQPVDGVQGTAHLKDVRAAMAKMKLKQTHHFMMLFADEASGKPIEAGSVALKITDPSGTQGKAVRLVAMAGHFGADVELTQPGDYTFTVGTRLADDKTREFEFTYTLK